MWLLGNCSKNRLVNFLLKRFPLFAGRITFGRFFKHLTCSLCFPLSLEHVRVDVWWTVGNIDLSLRSYHVRLWDTSQRNPVQLIRTGHQNETRILQVLQEHHPLSLVSTGKENDNSSRSQRLLQFRSSWSLTVPQRFFDIFSWIKSWLSYERNSSLPTVLITTDGLDLSSWLYGFHCSSSCGLFALVQSSFAVDSTSTERYLRHLYFCVLLNISDYM